MDNPKCEPLYRCNEREGTVDKDKLMAQALAAEAANIIVFVCLYD